MGQGRPFPTGRLSGREGSRGCREAKIGEWPLFTETHPKVASPVLSRNRQIPCPDGLLCAKKSQNKSQPLESQIDVPAFFDRSVEAEIGSGKRRGAQRREDCARTPCQICLAALFEPYLDLFQVP
ncbi:MAG: hypothetical protein QOF70_855 [Acetobacteraceae bacterium]|nr:hypothetical protein [Acetobacteraceae bacterium]